MPCKLSISPVGSWCHFDGPTGATVTLVVRGTVGRVRFAKARYDGVDLVVSQITVGEEKLSGIRFDVAEGPRLLNVVYGFSSGANGRGELLEHCGGASTLLLDDEIRGDNEARAHRLCGA